MIDLIAAKKYCCDKLYLIENYDKAINDDTQTWDCHHRLEIDENLSRQYLIDNNRYLNVPASELIFLTKTEHRSLHNKNRPPISEETKRKQSKAMKDKKHTEEAKRKMSESHKGIESPNKGKSTWNKGIHTGIVTNGFKGHKHSEETKRKMSESHKKKKAA